MFATSFSFVRKFIIIRFRILVNILFKILNIFLMKANMFTKQIIDDMLYFVSNINIIKRKYRSANDRNERRRYF